MKDLRVSAYFNNDMAQLILAQSAYYHVKSVTSTLVPYVSNLSTTQK